MPFSREHELLLQKVRNFTDTEFICLEAWLVSAEIFQYELSADVLRSGLDLEHYQSVLDPDPEKWTDEQRESLNAFLIAFEKDVTVFTGNPAVQVRLKLREIANRINEALARLLKNLKGE